jgi:hypothetical protein
MFMPQKLHLKPGERIPHMNWIGRWMRLGADLDAVRCREYYTYNTNIKV